MDAAQTDLTEATISAALADRGVALRPFRCLNETQSTNDDALSWLAEATDAVDGAFVVADLQTKGRGRLGRTWVTTPGGALTLTYLMRPQVEQLARVGMLGALSVCETIRHGAGAHVRCGIKWPNDVQINGRKVCGVLPEAAWDGSRLRGVALGIGLNVRLDFAGTAQEQTAVSLEPALGLPIDRADLLARLIERLDYWRAQIASTDLFDTWRAHLNMIGERVSVSEAAGVVNGVAEAVEPSGALLLRLDDGSVQRVIAGDIALG